MAEVGGGRITERERLLWREALLGDKLVIKISIIKSQLYFLIFYTSVGEIFQLRVQDMFIFLYNVVNVSHTAIQTTWNPKFCF